MATTTTTKKKLVYKQDSDGVFRLKREHSSPTLDKPYRSVADCANELIDCAYTITDAPAAPTLQGAPAPSPTHPAKKTNFELALRRVEIASAARPASLDIPSAHLPTSILDLPTIASLRVPLLSMSAPMERFHGPSFIGGVVLAVALHRMSPLIFDQAQSLFHVLKVVTLWGVAALAVAWYMGLVKPLDFVVVKDVLVGATHRINGAGAPHVAIEEPTQYPRTAVPDDISVTSTESARRKGRSRLASPAKTKNTLTSVKPYYHPQKPPPAPIAIPPIPETPATPNPTPFRLQFQPPPPLARHSTDDVRVRRAPELRRNLHQSSYDVRPAHPDPHARDFGDELPFINKVNLLDERAAAPPRHPARRAALPQRELPEVPRRVSTESLGNLLLGRLNTVLSKKSVLGTRANYKKFIDNVYDDND
jgi:hypothetical protein